MNVISNRIWHEWERLADHCGDGLTHPFPLDEDTQEERQHASSEAFRGVGVRQWPPVPQRLATDEEAERWEGYRRQYMERVRAARKVFDEQLGLKQRGES
jgi:hypothetical protein